MLSLSSIDHSDKVDPSLRDLIDRLLEKNPQNRITIQDVKVLYYPHYAGRISIFIDSMLYF